MNILFFTSEIPDETTGGVEVVTLCLKKIFQENGHKVYGLCKFDTNGHSGNIKDFCILPEQDSAVSDANISFAKTFCKEKNIDIIINNGVHHDLVLLANVLRNKKISVISCLHISPNMIKLGIWDDIVNTLWSNKGMIRWCKLFFKLLKLPLCYSKRMTWIRKKYYEMYHYSDALVLESDYYKQDFVSIAKINNAGNLVGIANPIPWISSDSNLPSTNKKQIVLWIGRMNFMQKRPDRILKIWQRVQKNNPDWSLWMCGDGPARPYLEDYCNRKRIKNVKFLGRIKSRDCYPHASIFCLTSSYEGFGMVVVEALTSKVPCVIFESYPVLADICVNHGNSILVPAFSYKKFADALNSLMNDPVKREEMANFDSSYLDKFSQESIGKQWELLFKKLKNC